MFATICIGGCYGFFSKLCNYLVSTIYARGLRTCFLEMLIVYFRSVFLFFPLISIFTSATLGQRCNSSSSHGFRISYFCWVTTGMQFSNMADWFFGIIFVIWKLFKDFRHFRYFLRNRRFFLSLFRPICSLFITCHYLQILFRLLPNTHRYRPPLFRRIMSRTCYISIFLPVKTNSFTYLT